MPNWKKLIVSGSDAALNSLTVTTSVTATSFTGSFSGSFTAPGSTTQVLYNNGGVVSAASGLVYSGSSVGIGTTTPSYKLHVASNGGYLAYFQNTSATDYRPVGFTDENNAVVGSIGYDTTIDRFSISDTSGKVITINTGNVGIGTTAPQAKLDIAGDLFMNNNAIWFRAANNYINSPAVSTLALTTAGSERVRIDSSGNVGIGTTSPQTLLHVDTTGTDARIRVSAGTNTVQGGMIANSSTNLVYAGSVSNHGFSLRTNDADRVRIDTTGNVGIGTTSPGAILDVKAAVGQINLTSTTGTNPVFMQYVNTSGQVFIGSEGSTAGNLATGTLAYAGLVSQQTAQALQFGTNSSIKMTITSGGNVGIGTTTPSSKLSINGGLHVGGDSDAGDNNLLVDGTMGVTGIGTFSTDVTIAGTLTVQTIVAQTITSSISFITGSTKFGSLLSNTHQFTGSVSMTGSLAFNDTLTTYTTLASSAAGSNTLFTQATGSYTSAFFKYTATSASNARSGEVVAIWNGAATEYADYSTVDIGTTNNVTASVSLAAANVLFSMQTNSASWKIKSIATYM